MKKAYSLFALAMLAALVSCEKKQEVNVDATTTEQPAPEAAPVDATPAADAAPAADSTESSSN